MLNIEDARGFIFDCDGTLLDTLDAWDNAERALFEEAGELTSEQEDEIHAAPIEEAARILHERYKVMTSSDAVLAHLDAYLLPYYRGLVHALPGACEFVRTIYEAGIPCVVVSSSPTRYLEAGLERAGILDCFSELISTEDVGTSKQDPRIYEHACHILDAPASHVWAVDDAPYALSVMREVGLNTIGVGNGCSEERAQQLRARAHYYAPSLENLL